MNEQWDVKIVEEGMKNGRRRLRRDEEGRGQVNGGWRTVGVEGMEAGRRRR